MHLRESLQMALRTLVANRLRSGLTMLGIIIGNSSVIAMVGIGDGAQRYINEQLQTLGPNVMFVIPGSREARQRGGLDIPRTLVVDDAVAIATQVPTVVGVAPEFNSQGTVIYRNRNATVSIVGTNEQFPQVRSFDIGRGRFFSPLDLNRNAQVVVLGATLAERLFDQENPVGQSIRIQGSRFDVVGVLAAKGANLGLNYDDAVLVPITTQASRLVGQRRSPYGIEVSYIAVSARDRATMGQAEFQITNLLRLRHSQGRNSGEVDEFFINSQDTLLNLADTVTGALTLLLAAIAGISLVVGGIGIMNIMLVSVRERTQEIGLRKAIGASQGDILGQFLIEAIILSVAGGAVGTGLGLGVIALMGVLTPFQGAVSGGAILFTVGISGGIGLFFGVVPARQAAKLDPIVALRSS